MKKIIYIAILGVFLAFILSFSIHSGLKLTSNDNFCVKCHSMEPMVSSYYDDVHGGANDKGFKASCSTCHLPHDNLANYLFTKAKNGIVEFTITALDKDKNINWDKKRANRARFTYDSSCLECHVNILTMKNEKNEKQIQMHEHYISLKDTQKQLSCVSCHVNVGHYGLRSKIHEIQPIYSGLKKH